MSKYTCMYCGHRGNKRTRDTEHIVPKKVRRQRQQSALTRGHERGIYELLPDTAEACYKCNRSKGGMTPGDWARWLAKHPDKLDPWPDGDRRQFMRNSFSLP